MTEQVIRISDGQIFMFGLRGMLNILMPFLVCAYLCRRCGGRVYSFCAGMAAMLLLAPVRAVLRSILMRGADDFLGKFLTSILVGAVCEELARYFTMKYAMQTHDTLPDALCYGAGHDGIESISQGFTVLMNQFSDARHMTGTPEHLQVLAGITEAKTLWMLVCDGFGTAAQMALSVLVFRMVFRGGSRYSLLAAIGLHMLMNAGKMMIADWFDILVITALIYRLKRTE